MRPIDYLHLQMRLEGKALVGTCSIRQVEVIPDEELPLLLLAQLADGELITYYDEELPADLRKELSAAAIGFPSVAPLLHVLTMHQRQAEVGHYKTYVFPPLPHADAEVLRLPKQDSRVRAFGFDSFAEDVFAMEQNGVLVSACVSTRENERCGEAWVFTRPEYRRQGWAQKVIRAWAASLQMTGKVPFYSHKIANTASLAKKLALVPVFEEVAITQT